MRYATVLELSRMMGMNAHAMHTYLKDCGIEPATGDLYDIAEVYSPGVRDDHPLSVPEAYLQKLITRHTGNIKAWNRWKAYRGHLFPEYAKGHYSPDVAKAILLDAGRFLSMGKRILQNNLKMSGQRYRIWQMYQVKWKWMLPVPAIPGDCNWIARKETTSAYKKLDAHVDYDGNVTILRPFPDDEFCILISDQDEEPPLPEFIERFINRRQS